MVQAIPYARFASEVLEIYSLKAPATTLKMRQVLTEIGSLPDIETTADLRPVVVARWIQAHPGRSPATVDSLLRSFRSACAIGLASGYLHSTPADRKIYRVDVPARTEEEEAARFHSLEAIGRVLTHLAAQAGDSWHDHRLYAVACTAAYTGLRRLELLRLQLGDVDLERGILRVVARVRLKTRASAAPAGIPDALAGVLREWVPHAGPLWLFPGVTRRGPWTGGPPGYKALHELKTAGLDCGVEGFTFLSLRHSWATHAEAWGLGPAMIQRQLRHTSIRTQRHYRHPDATNLAAAVRSIAYPSA